MLRNFVVYMFFLFIRQYYDIVNVLRHKVCIRRKLWTNECIKLIIGLHKTLGISIQVNEFIFIFKYLLIENFYSLQLFTSSNVKTEFNDETN